MFWLANIKKDNSHIKDIERYEYKEENNLLDEINATKIKDDISEMLYIKDDLIIIS